MGDQLVAETSTWQHTTLTTDKHPCPPVGFEHTISAGERLQAARLRPHGYWDRQCLNILQLIKLKNVYFLIFSCQPVQTIYTGCRRRKGQNFGRVFLMLKYTDITQNTYIQSWTVTDIMAREKCALLAGLRTVPCQLTAYRMSIPDCRVRLQKYRWRTYVSTPLWLTACHV